MTAATDTVTPQGRWRPAAWRNLLRDYPVVPLLILLVLLVVVVQLTQPGTVNAGWAAVNIRQAVVLAILAGCQTLTMLTGGIDLSVAYVASMSGFVTATFVHQPGGWVLGIAVALGAAALAGLVNGVGIGIFRVHPLIMTLGMGLIVLRLLERLAAAARPDRVRGARSSCAPWAPASPATSSPTTWSSSSRSRSCCCCS